ncbi:hypothetical protein PF008_g22073, partial [Phytophthora fragariae]
MGDLFCAATAGRQETHRLKYLSRLAVASACQSWLQWMY